jgi:hypothetical protein
MPPKVIMLIQRKHSIHGAFASDSTMRASPGDMPHVLEGRNGRQRPASDTEGDPSSMVGAIIQGKVSDVLPTRPFEAEHLLFQQYLHFPAIRLVD